MGSLTVDEFLAQLPTLDEPFAAKCAAASAAGEVLRYAATIADGVLKVSLVSVSADTPLGRLAGTDNLVEARSRRGQLLLGDVRCGAQRLLGRGQLGLQRSPRLLGAPL